MNPCLESLYLFKALAQEWSFLKVLFRMTIFDGYMTLWTKILIVKPIYSIMKLYFLDPSLIIFRSEKVFRLTFNVRLLLVAF